MGMFNSYTKPGPGIDKNAPKKKGFFLFWEIVFRKFKKFIQANMLYSVCSLLWFAFLYIIAPVSESFVNGVAASVENVEDAALTLTFGLRSAFAITVFNLWGFAPASVPYAYITRCFTRGEHVWIISDGWKVFKENIKHSLALLALDIVMIIAIMGDLVFYTSQTSDMGNMIFWQVMSAVVVMVTVVYTIMHYYIYQIMVTFECSFAKLLKNAAICAVGDLPMAVVCTVVSVGVNVLLFMLINPILVLIFDFIFGLCVTRYPMEFRAARVMEKNLKNLQKRTEAQKPQITYISGDGENEDNEAVSEARTR